MQAAIAHGKLHTVRGSTPYLWALAMVSLVYLLLVAPCMHRPHSPGIAHDTLEIVHLPRGATGNDTDAARLGQDLRPSHPTTDQSAGPTPTSGDPAAAALVCALGLVLLAFFVPAAPIHVFFRTADAVLGVGRWHRAVVLLL